MQDLDRLPKKSLPSYLGSYSAISCTCYETNYLLVYVPNHSSCQDIQHDRPPCHRTHNCQHYRLILLPYFTKLRPPTPPSYSTQVCATSLPLRPVPAAEPPVRGACACSAGACSGCARQLPAPARSGTQEHIFSNNGYIRKPDSVACSIAATVACIYNPHSMAVGASPKHALGKSITISLLGLPSWLLAGPPPTHPVQPPFPLAWGCP